MAAGTQDDASDSENSASTVVEQKVDFNGFNNRDKNSKYTRKSDNKRRKNSSDDGTRNPNSNKNPSDTRKTNENNADSNNKRSSNSDSDRGTHAVAHQGVKAVLTVSVFSAALSLASFVASLEISDSPVGIVSSVLECVVALGIFGVGLFGVLQKDPSFLGLYTVFGICMALAQTVWVVLGSYSIYQLIASLRVTKDEEERAMIKGVLRSFQTYVAAAALSIISYSLAAWFARRLKELYQEDNDNPNGTNQDKRRDLRMDEAEQTRKRHATVAVASPFA